MTDTSIPGAIELLVGLLGLAALVAIVARPLRLPYSVALVVAGVVVGLVASAAGFPPIDVSPELVLLVLLPGLVFEAAYRLRLAELRRWFGGLALLAIPGVLVSAAVVAVVLNLATGLRLDLAFIVGAMVSATDPAAVVATFKRLRVPPALSTMVDGESLLNDGTGLVLFAIAVQAVVAPIGPAEAVVTFVATVAISIAIGLVTGYLATLLMGLLDDHLVELTISVVLAYGSYILADQLGLSGVIATVTAAIVLGNVGPGRTMSAGGADAIDTVWEFVAYLLTAVVFLEVGLAIDPGRLRRLDRADRLGGGRASSSAGPSWSTSCSAARRASRARRGWRNGSRAAGSTSCSGPVCAGRWPSRWRCRCPSTSRSATSSRRSPSASSCSPCWCRGRPSAGSSTGRSAWTRRPTPPRGLRALPERPAPTSAGGRARVGPTPPCRPTVAGPRSAGCRRSPGDSCARSVPGRAIRCTRGRAARPHRGTSPHSARS